MSIVYACDIYIHVRRMFVYPDGDKSVWAAGTPLLLVSSYCSVVEAYLPSRLSVHE